MYYEDVLPLKTFRLTPSWRKRSFLLSAKVFEVLLILFILIYADLWQSATEKLGILVFLLLGIGMFACCVALPFGGIFLLTLTIHHEADGKGVTFHMPDYSIYTPWKNIRGIGSTDLGISTSPALLLQTPAVKGTIRQGREQQRAVLEPRWLTSVKTHRADAIPLSFTVPENWQESEFGEYIRRYAPHVFHMRNGD